MPDTGVGIELERLLAPVFVRGSAQYGTRASTLAYLSNDGGAGVHERTLGADVRREGEVEWHFARAGVAGKKCRRVIRASRSWRTRHLDKLTHPICSDAASVSPAAVC